jgi:uncharacterized paraquat-inducible protein A
MIKYTIKEIFFCKKCNIEVQIPDFTDNLKNEIKTKALSNQSVVAVSLIKDHSDLGLFYAKVLIDHINKNESHCLRCDYSELEGTNVFCPKCNAFNLNW